MFGRKKDNQRPEASTQGNASTNTVTRPNQTNINIIPFRFPWSRRGKVINKQYEDLEVNYDKRNNS